MENTDNKKYGFKGTNNEMKCRNTQFELGKTYFINHKDEVEQLPEGCTVLSLKNDIQTCTKQAIHYCDELEKTFGFYNNDGDNRFFKVEIIGDFVDDKDGKSGTRCLRFVEEISKDELAKLKETKLLEKLDSYMRLEHVKTLQTLNPNLIIGGSIALYLQGVRLKRFMNNNVDYDFCLPFFQLLKGDDKTRIGETVMEKEWDEDDEENPYNSDFETVITINGIKADVRVDPKQRYQIVTHNGFDYKVSPLLTIIEAKVKYAKTKWGKKHKDDLLEMILKK